MYSQSVLKRGKSPAFISQVAMAARVAGGVLLEVIRPLAARRATTTGGVENGIFV